MNSWACRLWKLRRLKFQSEVARWKTYVADFCAPPQMWAKSSKAGESRPEPSRIPNSITTVVRLMRLGMTETQAWTTPVGAASWYEAAYFEAECGSNLEIVTDAERIAILKSKAKRRAA